VLLRAQDGEEVGAGDADRRAEGLRAWQRGGLGMRMVKRIDVVVVAVAVVVVVAAAAAAVTMTIARMITVKMITVTIM
jgi:hypothetical protein